MSGWHIMHGEIPDWLIIGAVRYATGRCSVAPSITADWLVTNWNAIPERVRNIIRRDLEEEFRRDDDYRNRAERDGVKAEYLPLGWDCDRREWERVRNLWLTNGEAT